jgi:DNA-binding MarR family transcriptional regulator
MTEDWTDRLLAEWSKEHPETDLELAQVTARVSRIATHLARHQEDVFARFGLNRGDLGVLSALRIAGPPHRLSPTRLFKGLMLSSAGMTGRLDRLERRGLVRRTPDAADRRGILVDLTEAGLEAVDDAVRAYAESEQRLLSRLDRGDVERLSGLLRKLLAELEPAAASGD